MYGTIWLRKPVNSSRSGHFRCTASFNARYFHVEHNKNNALNTQSVRMQQRLAMHINRQAGLKEPGKYSQYPFFFGW